MKQRGQGRADNDGRFGRAGHPRRPSRAVGLTILLCAVTTAGSLASAVLTTGEAAALSSSTTTTQVSTSSITLGPSGNVSDGATVQGNSTSGSPSGTVTFYACQTGTTQTLTTGPCAAVAGNHVSNAHLTAGASNTSTAPSGAFTPRSAGTWCFSATYGGDTNYSGSADNTTTGNLDTNECVMVMTSTPILATTASAPNITFGPAGTVTDGATVTGNTVGGHPTGTVVFYVCQTGTSQTLTPGPCAASGAPEDPGESLVSGGDDTSSTTSASFTPTSGGTWCFSAVYNGDSNYSAAATNTTSLNLDSNECVLVTTAAAPTSSTISSATITLGPTGTVTDGVTVTGNSLGGSPSGTVVFYACKTGTSQTLTTGPCAASGTPEDPGKGLAAGPGNTSSATSSLFTPTSGGTWCFSASYGGSNDYSAASDNTSAGNLDPNECVLVLTAPAPTASTISSATITLGPSGTVTDSVTVTGNSVGGSPSGTVVFYACKTGTSQTLTTGPCAASGTPEDPGEGLAAGSGNTSSATSSSFLPTAAGTWCFSASYGGSNDYSAASDNTSAGNLDANECVLVTSASSNTATAISSAHITVGPSGSVTDAVTVTGNTAGGAPTGKVDFYVCGPMPTNALCTSTASPEGTPTLASSSSDTSTAPSQSFSPSTQGVYCFAAVYVPGSGSNYTGSSDNNSGSVDASECVMVSPAPYSIISPNNATFTAGQSSTFIVMTAFPTGTPVPKIKRSGPLPRKLKFVNNHNGTATLSGIASTKKIGFYHLTITATFGRGKSKHVATQAFTLTVN
jgi:hypothetical protein